MIRLFKHYIPHAVLLLGLFDFALLLVAGDLAWVLRAEQMAMEPGFVLARLPMLLAFAAVTQSALIAVGVFGADALRSLRFAGARLVVGGILGNAAFRRRVLVLGAGTRAIRIGRLAERPESGFVIAGYIAMSDGQPAVAEAVPRAAIAAFAALVKLDSGGPAFFRQRRIGPYGEPFELIKLRSMRTDAEKDGAKWAQKDDPRVTRLGKLIRKLRFDELPQTWSVLRGRMSFVGPRPEVSAFVDDLDDKLSFYAERQTVKRGITGWAQVNYPYGASIEDARAKLEYDLYYAKNYTPFLDLLIMLQTCRVILWPEGAR